MLPSYHQNKMLQEMSDLQSFGRRGGLFLGSKQSLALLSPVQTSAAYRADLKKTGPFFTCTVSELCLQTRGRSILGRQLLVLLLACLSSSTKQMWGGPPSKYFGFSLDRELCNTHRHTHKPYFVVSAKTGGRNNRRWARRPFQMYSELCI